MMRQLALLEGVKPRILDPYPTKCPYCTRALTRRGGMSAAVKFRDWIAKNVDAVSQVLLLRQASAPLPQIVLRPDLEYGMQLEADALGLTLEELVNQLADGYLEGEHKRLRRRARRHYVPPQHRPTGKRAPDILRKLMHP